MRHTKHMADVITWLLPFLLGLLVGGVVVGAIFWGRLSAAKSVEQQLTVLHEQAQQQAQAQVQQIQQQSQMQVQQAQQQAQQFVADATAQLQRFTEQQIALTEERTKTESVKNQASVTELVMPLQQALQNLQKQTENVEKQHINSTSTLAEQLKHLSQATTKLESRTNDFINTLRRSDVRGNWGEVQLRRVVELAGMTAHVDFVEQPSLPGAEGTNLRPDLVVKLAGGKSIVVDSKVALSALLAAFESEDPHSHEILLKDHARQVRTHIDQLSSKKYWDQFASIGSAPEFVVMFMPSEAFFQVAVEQEPQLVEYAFGKRVVIATPTTLVALLRTVAHAWKEEALAENARKVFALGKELHDRLSTMNSHLDSVGRALSQASNAYNRTVGSYESRVLVSARKFGELQELVEKLDAPQQVEVALRVAPEIAAPESPRELENPTEEAASSDSTD